MSESSTEHADAGWPHDGSEQARAADPWAPGGPVWPHPAAPYAGGTRWGEGTARGRAESPDQSSRWGAPDPPAAVPDPIPGAEGPHTRPGWLMRSRTACPDETAG